MTTATATKPQLETIVDARAYAVSKRAAGRILGVTERSVKSVECWASVVLVVIKGVGARFVGYQKFEADYHASRLQGSRTVKLSLLSSPYDLDLHGWYVAKSEGSNEGYEVVLRDYDGQPYCACPDHKRAVEGGRGHHLCKHLVALANR